MGFHHRKLFSEGKSHKADNGLDPCNFCYNGCPVECKNTNILPTSSPPSSKHQIPTNLILMLCSLAAAFMFLFYLAVRRYRWSLRNSRTVENANNREFFTDENQGPALDHPIWYIRTVGLQQSVIDSIAVFKYEKGQGKTEGTDCSVCLNEFQEAETLRVLPKCSHAFHLPCVDTWLRTHQNCPVCRAPIVGNANTSPANSVLANSNDLGSSEEDRVDNELDRYAVETDETREMRAGIENEPPIQIEDGKMADLSHTK